MTQTLDDAAWEAAATLLDQVDVHLASGELDAAAATASQAAADLAHVLGADHPDALNATVTLCAVRIARGDAVGALPALTAARAGLDRWRREPVVRPLRARVRLLRGDALRQAGRYGEAVEELRSAVRLAEGTELTFEAHNALGIALRFAGELAAAARAYRRAWNRATNASQRAAIHHNRSGLAHARGDLAGSEAEARRALALRGAARDAGVGADLGGLALAIAEQGRPAEALELYAAARAIYADTLPPHHPEVAYLLHNLGDTLVDLGRHADALVAYDEALDIKRRGLGPDHPEVAITLANSRFALPDDPIAAAARLTEARRIVQATLPTDHPFRCAIEAAPDGPA